MAHVVTITYDRSLVLHALNCFMVRRLGKSFFGAFLLVATVMSYEVFTNSWSPLLKYLCIAVGVVFAGLSFLYVVRLRAAEGFFAKVTNPTVTLTFTTEGVHTRSEIGTSELKWGVFDELLKFTDVWLLVYMKSGYMTLPVAQMTHECMQFIEKQLTSLEKRTH